MVSVCAMTAVKSTQSVRRDRSAKIENASRPHRSVEMTVTARTESDAPTEVVSPDRLGVSATMSVQTGRSASTESVSQGATTTATVDRVRCVRGDNVSMDRTPVVATGIVRLDSGAIRIDRPVKTAVAATTNVYRVSRAGVASASHLSVSETPIASRGSNASMAVASESPTSATMTTTATPTSAVI